VYAKFQFVMPKEEKYGCDSFFTICCMSQNYIYYTMKTSRDVTIMYDI
jgi:hypothetical protein